MPTDQQSELTSHVGSIPATDLGQTKTATPTRDLTFGEKAVGITFNPGGHPLVNAIKEKAAEYIDVINAAREATTNGEVKRQLSIAITEAQTSQMWAVKAVTWQY